MLLLHGGGQTRHSWSETARTLADDGWHTISLDMRGHGESDWAPDADYHFSAFADDLLAVVRSLGAAPVIVGASLGGICALIAQDWARGELARALVLVDVAPRIEPRGAERSVAFMKASPDGFASLEEVADAVAAYNPYRARPGSTAGLEKNLRRGADGRYRWHWDPRFLEGDRGASREPAQLEDAARNLRIPTLLVRGRLSDLLSEEGARHFLGLVPHARYADVSGAGHMVAGDRNDAFTRAVRDFLASGL